MKNNEFEKALMEYEYELIRDEIDSEILKELIDEYQNDLADKFDKSMTILDEG